MVGRDAVAQAAGVSTYTVSVVLNDAAYGRVSAEVRERVRRVAAKLGYQPHAAGRALRLGRTELLAYITSPQLLHEVTSYHGALLPALLSSANAAGFDLAILGDDEPGQLLARLRRALQADRYDGIIVGRPRIDDPVIDLLKESEVPFVLAGSHPDDSLYQVRRDDAGVAGQVATQLLARGHRRVGYAGRAGSGQDFYFTRVRQETLRTALAADGGEFVILPEDPAAAIEMAAAGSCTAITAENDEIGVRMVGQAREVALEVPRDLAVVSLYGVRHPAPCDPTLASVCADPSEAGEAAVHLLASLIAGRPGQPPQEREIVLPSWFVDGESFGPARNANSSRARHPAAPPLAGRSVPEATVTA